MLADFPVGFLLAVEFLVLVGHRQQAGAGLLQAGQDRRQWQRALVTAVGNPALDVLQVGEDLAVLFVERHLGRDRLG